MTAFPPDTVPSVVQGWIRQLLDPQLWEMLQAADGGRIDVHLTAHKGRVRRQPAVLLNTGSVEMVEPEALT